MNGLEMILVFALVVFVAYFVKALTGFAGALVSVPILALFFDIRFVVPIVAVLDAVCGFILLASVKGNIDKKEMLYLLGGVFIGTLIGTYFLKTVESNTLKLVFGIVIIVFALRMIFERHIRFKKINFRYGSIFGLIGGVTGGMFSASGPPITLYLGNQLRNKQLLRGTLIGVFLIGAVWRNIVYIFTGMFQSSMYKIMIFMIPVLIIASILGIKAHLKISEDFYRKLVAIILLVAGALLLI